MSTWQNTLQQENDGINKEFACLQRRYHAIISPLSKVEDLSSMNSRIITCYLRLSDPDLPLHWKENPHEVVVKVPMDYPNTEPSINFPSLKRKMNSFQYEAFQHDIQTYAKNLIGNYSIRKLLTWVDNHIVSYVTECSEEQSNNNLEQVAPEKTVELEDENIHLNENTIKKNKSQKIQRICRYFRRNGKCREGEACKFSHETGKQIIKNGKSSAEDNLQEDIRNDKQVSIAPTVAKSKADKSPKLCKFYMQNACKKGLKCDFLHTPATTTVNEVPKLSEQLSSSSSTSEEGVDKESTIWNDEQQNALDAALEQYPALPKDASKTDHKQRWLNIANSVPNKTLQDCIERYQFLCRIIQKENLKNTAKVDTIRRTGESTELPSDSPEDGADVEDNRIIPTTQRITIYATVEEARRKLEVAAPTKSASATVYATISLDELLLYQIGTVVAHSLSMVVRCLSCPLTFTTSLSLRLQSDTIRRWCPRCSILHVVGIDLILVHEKASTLAILRSENCVSVNILPSELLATCLNCNAEVLLTGVEPRRRNEQSCFTCHTKLALNTSNIRVITDTPIDISDGKSSKGRKSSANVTLPVGQPLPKNGTCEHYKHSYRWFRFQCCLSLFPCDICHDQSDCLKVNAGVRASRQLCGFCSTEQTTNLKEQKCGKCNKMLGGRRVQASKSHWEGGEGCRNPLLMATGDRQKFKGLNKTQSHKSTRVGEEGKKRIMEKKAKMSKKA